MSIQEKLSNLLLSNERYQAENTEEQKVLNKTLVSAYAREYNPELLALLQSDKEVKNHFFVQVNDVVIFKLENFLTFINNRSFLPDSFTAFKNKIGLATDKENYLGNSRNVVLNWAYKDCVLEGGQSKDDQKRNEVFFNEVLAPDQINRLLDDKVFTNFKRYDKDGEHKVTELQKNDNLIIKGNNLVVLHSLKKRFAGKIKLIYIDPPYNTGSDSFQYNDKFNHSTWLTFMKNRLEVARELLSDDGVIFIQCDDNEQGYLKVLVDEIFGEDNFVETFVWKNTDNAPALSKKTRKNIEFIHCYEKKIDTSRGYIGRNSDNDDAPLLNGGNPITTLEFIPEIIEFKISDGNYPKGNYDKIELLDDLVVKNGKNENKIRLKGQFKWQQSFLDTEVNSGTYFLVKSNKFSIRYQRVIATIMAPDKLIDSTYLSKAIGIETNEDSKKHIDSLKLNFNSFPKPESLISFLIKTVTQESNIVLDFHLGSGTTAAVAHKMNRQYIGVEQMDYIESVSVERMKKVIAGEQGGISKSVNWQGGGEFVYCELQTMQKNLEMKSATPTQWNYPCCLKKQNNLRFCLTV